MSAFLIFDILQKNLISWSTEFVYRLKKAGELGPGGTANYLPNRRGTKGELPWYTRAYALNNVKYATSGRVDKRFELTGKIYEYV